MSLLTLAKGRGPIIPAAKLARPSLAQLAINIVTTRQENDERIATAQKAYDDELALQEADKADATNILSGKTGPAPSVTYASNAPLHAPLMESELAAMTSEGR